MSQRIYAIIAGVTAGEPNLILAARISRRELNRG